ncbi:MAG: GNAT family N-acetyltransferase [Trueperaceae bacterium]|nr:GNAT family N-acetyltransferase [Trueperaceae bacterium]
MKSPLRDQIRAAEAHAANAVPASHLQIVDGWRLRYNHGVTRRANSVLAEGHSAETSLDAKLADVEAFYQQFGVSPRFQVTPVSQPSQLAEALRAHGYRHAAAVDVLSVPVTTLQHHAVGREGLEPHLYPTLEPDWFSHYLRAEPHEGFKAEVRRRMLNHLVTPARFATVTDTTIDNPAAENQNEPLAVGLGVVEGGWLGIFNVATFPAARRRGAATTLLAALADWAARQGATNVYLQVGQGNTPAQTLYRRLGFAPFYQYHYYERD